MSFHRACCCGDEGCPDTISVTLADIESCGCFDTLGGGSANLDVSTLNGTYTLDLDETPPPTQQQPGGASVECYYAATFIDQIEYDDWFNDSACNGAADATQSANLHIEAWLSTGGTWYVDAWFEMAGQDGRGFQGSASGDISAGATVDNDDAVGDCVYDSVDPVYAYDGTAEVNP